MADIAFRDVHKSFGAKRLFNGLSLTCPDRKYLCLLGPSGCGKSTLMRLLAGLESPDSGDVLIGGERVNDLTPAARNVGLAFQNYALYPHLTVAGNLAFPLRAPLRRRRYTNEEVSGRVRKTAELLKIGALLDRKINQLSGGQQQRVALGRALIHEPRVLLLDEPVTHLDARLRYEMRAEIKLLHERIGTTTIHVTHDQQEALAVGDLIAVMREGRIEQVGEALEIYNNPANAFVAGFIGDPPMSLLTATATAVGDRAALRIAGVAVAVPESLVPVLRAAPTAEVVVGIRPSQVEISEGGSPATVPATLHAYEVVGREMQVTFSVAGDLVRYRTGSRRSWRMGEAVHLALSMSSARLFDKASGRALG